MSSALDNIGPHLLKRLPSKPDDRDFKLADYLATPNWDAVLAEVMASHSVAKATKDAFSVVIPALAQLVPAPPVPPPPTTVVSWADPDPTLDQGQTPHCVGFGWAQWGNTMPVNDNFVNADGDAIYYECKAIDGEPGAEDGSDVRSGAQAMQNRGRLKTYAFGTVDDAIAWIKSKGSIVMGTDWTNDMFNPDATGRVHPTGNYAGGHCYIADGYDPAADDLLFRNSWSDGWGLKGTFRMSVSEFKQLFTNQGEACAAVELP